MRGLRGPLGRHLLRGLRGLSGDDVDDRSEFATHVAAILAIAAINLAVALIAARILAEEVPDPSDRRLLMRLLSRM